MRLDSVQDLKSQLMNDIVGPIAARAAGVRRTGAQALVVSLGLPGLDSDPSLSGIGAQPLERVPEVQRSLALGVAPHGKEYWLAIRLQRPALRDSPIVEHLTNQAKGEVDIRMVGRIDKRVRGQKTASRRTPAAAARAAVPWHQLNTRPLLIGASVGHIDVTAGTLGAFVDRSGAVCILSNNHVLANEDSGAVGDVILQRAQFDGGKRPAEDVARLSQWVALKRRGANLVDAAIAVLRAGQRHDPHLLRELVNGKNRTLQGLGPQSMDEGRVVYKVGRTTGPTKGRVTAFDLDNLVVNYDVGNLRFDGQIEIEGMGTKGFSDGGDSGSLIVNSRMEAVALLFAGSDTGGRNGAGLTFANPIHRVLTALRVTLLS
jgi:hypothetical protein